MQCIDSAVSAQDQSTFVEDVAAVRLSVTVPFLSAQICTLPRIKLWRKCVLPFIALLMCSNVHTGHYGQLRSSFMWLPKCSNSTLSGSEKYLG